MSVVQKGQSVIASTEHGAIRHPTAHEPTVHDIEVSTTWLTDNPGTHLICQTCPAVLPSQSIETCEIEGELEA